ncbi:hypothetical protein D3C85_1457080 [compost metagenome]
MTSGLITMVLLLTSTTEWPSAGAPSRFCVPTTRSAPGRFSTKVACPETALNCSAISRVSVSPLLPGPMGTMKRTAREG